MTNNDILEIKQLIQEPKKIVIVPHKNPDGDAIGSSLGLYHYLKTLNHDVAVIVPNDYPSFLKWIPGNNSVIVFEVKKNKSEKIIEDADIIFTLDFNALRRTGDMETSLEHSKATKILIDHHQQPDNYAKYIYSDVSICATSQMIYHFLEMLDATEDISKDIATCLYVGIMTDTGSFKFPSTTSTTHRVIAELIDKGADNSSIHNNVYDTNSYNKLQLLGCALSNLKVLRTYNTAYITLTEDELQKYQFKKGDTEGVVNYGLAIEGVKFAVIFIEQKKEGIIKMSLRSKGDFDVNTLAREHFNGGGHINAAGGRSERPLKDTIRYFKSILPQYKTELNL
ncbi:MAG: bifunctional oligoribonuclease/PAP phosphatase NrnA [Flavobacteriaceae bacterium]|nr:bifunctional oligoribonuclease/PAP phosphatase NrnA [Flavobacteriaceae bacterium]